MPESFTNTSLKHPLIGISGTFAGGKDTLAKYLENDFGFTHVSTGDIVREIAMKERGSIERPVLFEVATRHRKEEGAGAFVVMALDKPRPLVITGIRSLGEARALKDAGGVLLFIDGPLEVRYQRMIARQRDTETQLTLEEFKQNEQKEWYGGETDADFNLRDIKKMSGIVIENDFTLDEFIDYCYKKLSLK